MGKSQPEAQPNLVAPFAVVAVVTALLGGQVAYTLTRHVAIGKQWLIEPWVVGLFAAVWLPLVVPVGWIASRARRRLRSTSLGVAVACALTGWVLGELAWITSCHDYHRGDDLLDGLGAGLCLLPTVVLFALVTFGARRVGRARVGSVVDASDRRAAWWAVALALALLSAFAAVALEGPAGGPRLVAVSAVALAALLAYRDGHALGVVDRAAERLTGLSRCAPGRASAADAPRVDLGLGDEEWHELAPGDEPYRGSDRVLAVLAGDPARARHALKLNCARTIAALALAVGALMFQLTLEALRRV